MNKYLIRYITTEGDSSSIWVSADNKEEAIYKAEREYWDIKDIVTIDLMD